MAPVRPLWGFCGKELFRRGYAHCRLRESFSSASGGRVKLSTDSLFPFPSATNSPGLPLEPGS